MKAEVAKKWAEQEELLKSMDNGDTNHSDVEQLINKINLQGHIAMYYTGGLNLLAQQIDNSKENIWLDFMCLMLKYICRFCL